MSVLQLYVAEAIENPTKITMNYHLAGASILDGSVKLCPKLQELLDSGLQVFNLEAKEW